MAASAALDALLARLGDQHEGFLREAASAAVQALKGENQRLSEELARVKFLLSQKRVKAKAPPVPCLPAVLGFEEYWTTPSSGELGGTGCTAGACAERPGTAPAASLVERASPLRLAAEHHVMSALCPAGARAKSREEEMQRSLQGGRPHPAFGRQSSRMWPPLPTPEVLLPGMLASPDVQGYHSTLAMTRTASLQGPAKVAAGVCGDGGFSISHSGNGRATIQVQELDERYRTRQRRRLRALLGLGEGEDYVSVAGLLAVLRARDEKCQLDTEALGAVIAELKALQRHVPPSGARATDRDAPAQGIAIDALADLVSVPKLQNLVAEEVLQDVLVVVGLLNMITVEEVVEEVTRRGTFHDAPTAQAPVGNSLWESRFNVVVITSVLFNVTSMGISIDYEPEHPGWFALEAYCTFVFVAEALIKNIMWGPRIYFRGPAWRWNVMDFAITLVSLLEQSLTAATRYGDLIDHINFASAARIALVMRALRLARLMRLMKLLHTPLLRDLANMLLGFVIGIPSLLWVLVLFLIVLYGVGLTFRLCFGPDKDQNLIAMCGPPDDMVKYNEPICKVHYMYGEEFFGTVRQSMFTSFRFMLGDYSSRKGVSLVVTFSHGYGWSFNTVFVAFMIVVIFGLFNIITAIFVESTTTGLKHNNAKRRLEQHYERNYVKAKLLELIARIQYMCEEIEAERAMSLPESGHPGGNGEHGHAFVGGPDFAILEDDFVYIMEDGVVRMLLRDLDVEMFSADSLFDTFDPDGNGLVMLPELIQAIMKLRGDPQKNDIIAAWVAVKSLHEKFDQFTLLHSEDLDKLKANQQTIIKALIGGAPTPSLR